MCTVLAICHSAAAVAVASVELGGASAGGMVHYHVSRTANQGLGGGGGPRLRLLLNNLLGIGNPQRSWI